MARVINRIGKTVDGASASITVKGVGAPMTGDNVTVTTPTGATKQAKYVLLPNPEAHGLPSGYTELEYIQSSNNQWVETNLSITSTTNVVLDFKTLTTPSTSDAAIFFSAKTSWDYDSFSLFYRANTNKITFHGHEQDFGTFAANTHYKFEGSMSTGTGTLTNVTAGTSVTTSLGTNSSLSTLKLLKYFSSSQPSANCQVYRFTIYNGADLAGDFIPCKNSDNAIGLYDLVTKDFFSNSGSDAFEPGPEISQGEYVWQVDKLGNYGIYTVNATISGAEKTKAVNISSAIDYTVDFSGIDPEIIDGLTFYPPALGIESIGDIGTTAIDPSNINALEYFDCSYSGVVKSATLPKGTYYLQVWGAQGGYRSSSSNGGAGGYSYGSLILPSSTTLYLYSGGAGNTGGTSGGFNGGGTRDTYNGGGGGTDIRIGTDSLYARVIVAAGGGSDGAASRYGMYGGGETGGTTTQSYGTGGGGGTQTAGGSGGNNNPGTFGAGGTGLYRSSGYGGAGGGGWYGGGGAYPDGSADDDRGGGGGSGYVYNENTAGNYPSGCLLTSANYLSYSATVAGNLQFVGTGGVQETGHLNDGFLRISRLR